MECVLIHQRLFVQINHSDELSMWRIKRSHMYFSVHSLCINTYLHEIWRGSMINYTGKRGNYRKRDKCLSLQKKKKKYRSYWPSVSWAYTRDICAYLWLWGLSADDTNANTNHDNNTQLTVHDYIGSLAFMPNEAKLSTNQHITSQTTTYRQNIVKHGHQGSLRAEINEHDCKVIVQGKTQKRVVCKKTKSTIKGHCACNKTSPDVTAKHIDLWDAMKTPAWRYTTFDNCWPNSSSFCWRGVLSVSVSTISVRILPRDIINRKEEKMGSPPLSVYNYCLFTHLASDRVPCVCQHGHILNTHSPLTFP